MTNVKSEQRLVSRLTGTLPYVLHALIMQYAQATSRSVLTVAIGGSAQTLL